MTEPAAESRPPKDLYELEKVRILREMEDELWAWAKRRGWIVGLVAALVGVAGVWGIGNQLITAALQRPIEDSRAKLVDMQVQTELARRAAAMAGNVADQASGQLQAITTALDALRKQADGVNGQFVRVSGQIDATAQNAVLRSTNDYKVLRERIDGLERLVKTAASDSQGIRVALAEYERLKIQQPQIEEDQRRFAENSKYSVTVVHLPSQTKLASQIQDRLSGVGFRASRAESDLLDRSLRLQRYRPGARIVFDDSSAESRAQQIASIIKPFVGEARRHTRDRPEWDRTPHEPTRLSVYIDYMDE